MNQSPDEHQEKGSDPFVFDDLERLASARHGDPFSFLGRHRDDDGVVYRCFKPRARQLWIENDRTAMERVPGSDLFEYRPGNTELPHHPLLIWEDEQGIRREAHDPYSFGPVLNAQAMRSFHEGSHYRAQELLGSHLAEIDFVHGTLFSVWAPHAERLSVVGDFNEWDGRCHPMRMHPEFGIWEVFVPGVLSGPYKYEIRSRATGEVLIKSDPFARWSERRPATASVICPHSKFPWKDGSWLRSRERANSLKSRISVYEVHLGSWRRGEDGSFLDYATLAKQICDYVKRLGFTHIELLPMKEHPLDESWGYQSTGYFSPTSRHGNPDDFRAFVDHCHRQGVGVILDWVPAHFPKDAHALARFDGTSLFEYHDYRKAEHRDWGTLVFNYERSEVRSFLISSALYWMREFHIDGLRVDAVASMLYLNFSRQSEQWVPNKYGGNENLEAIEFIRALNAAVSNECPDCLMIAEESSDWWGVTHAVDAGGLGFTLKWNMGWMHDTLNYMSKDPIHRKHHQDWLTFGPLYAFNENFMLPLSHDEVVHLKKSLFGRMPGDEWQKFANLRLLYCYQWMFPGKQLLFMGGEFAQEGEWNASESLPWGRSEHPMARGTARLITELNRLQARHPALAQWDCDSRGFEWLNGEDNERSVITFLRHGKKETVAVALNFTPEPRPGYRIPIHKPGRYQLIFNSDMGRFGGSDFPVASAMETEDEPFKGREQSLVVDLPPLGAIVVKHL